MEQKKQSRDLFKKLRLKAEALSRAPIAIYDTSPADIAKLVSELEIHQIELELQNDELRKTRNELEASRREYFELFDIAPVGYVTIGRDGKIIRINLTLADMLMHKRRDLAGSPITRLLAPESYSAFHQAVRDSDETAEMRVAEFKLRRSDGAELMVRAELNSTPSTPSLAAHIKIAVSDITELKIAEKELRNAKEEWECTFNAIDDCITILDTDMRIRRLNRSAIEAIGLEEKDIIGRHCYRVFSNQDTPCSQCPVTAALQDNRSQSATIDNAFLEKILKVGAFPLRKPDGSIYGVVHTAQDISEIVRLEENMRQTQKMESIGTLAGGVAHEFNNVLSIILGNTELAIFDIPEEKSAYKNLKEIERAALRAREVVRQLLTFCRKADRQMKPCSITSVVQESLNLIRSTIPRHIKISCDIPGDIHPVVADSTQIHQIVFNLCGNAADAMIDRGGMITIALGNITVDEKMIRRHPALKAGPHVKLTIGDNGIGMTEETMKRIFEPFFTTKSVGKGTGIGLAVVHGIMARHNGAVSVESAPEKGTVFTMLFPASGGPINADTPEISAEADIPQGSERILFVDDEAAIVRLEELRLGSLGYRIRGMTYPEAALDLFRANPYDFDLVITDYIMPDMTGDKLAAEIQRIRPGMPVILCSGYQDAVSKERALEMGISAFCTKPFGKVELLAAIRSVLN